MGKKLHVATNDSEMVQALIPGLPDEIAEACLLLVPYYHLPILASVCGRWRQMVRSPDFHSLRRRAGISRRCLAFTQTPSPTDTSVRHLTLFDPTSSTWHSLPPIPARLARRNPRLVGVGHRIVAMAWCPNNSFVRIYDLLTGTWRRGAPMPGGPRYSFLGISDGVRRVLVAGGYTRNNVMRRSVMTYDLDEDVWEILPDTAKGKSPLELINVPPRDWSMLDLAGSTFLFAPFPYNLLSTIALQGRLYNLKWEDGMYHFVVREGETWRTFLNLPNDLRSGHSRIYLSVWREGFLFCGSKGAGEPDLQMYTLEGDIQSSSWKAHEVPEQYYKMGELREGTWLEI